MVQQKEFSQGKLGFSTPSRAPRILPDFRPIRNCVANRLVRVEISGKKCDFGFFLAGKVCVLWGVEKVEEKGLEKFPSENYSNVEQR